jgi:hypothetical protein
MTRLEAAVQRQRQRQQGARHSAQTAATLAAATAVCMRKRKWRMNASRCCCWLRSMP